MHQRLVAHTIPVWNLSICRTGGPGVDIKCSNKELVLERGTGSRKFLYVAKIKSGRIFFPRSRGYDALITFRGLGRECDGRALTKSAYARKVIYKYHIQ